MCIKCHDFFGSSAYQGMCSTCHAYIFSNLEKFIQSLNNLKSKLFKKNNSIKHKNIRVNIKEFRKIRLNVFLVKER